MDCCCSCVAAFDGQLRFNEGDKPTRRHLSPAQVLGGKGGGKPAQAQCQGPNLDCIEDALQAALEFAALKLE